MMRYINRFFWWCAGTNVEVLEKCPTDHSKYFGVGGTIVFTALMASFAGGYAFFTAFKSTPLAFAFGVFWGLLIFNLDRYIVSTIGKGDGTSKITKEEWKIAAPRLIMAILLGFVIATPLELKIFETEIQTVVERLKIDKAEELKSRDVSFNTEFEETKTKLAKVENDLTELTNNKKQLSDNAGQFFDDKKKDLQKDLSSKISELNVIENKVSSLHSSYIGALKDSLATNIINSRKSLRDQEIIKRDKLRKERITIENEIKDLNDNKGAAILAEQQKIDKQISLLVNEKETLLDRVSELSKTRTNKRENYDNKVENYDGFAAHLEAMSILTEIKRDENGNLKIPAMFWAKWLITLLFIFIEVAPVLFKLMTDSGPYDDIMERIKHESNVREKQKISDINDEINTTIKISSERNKSRLDAELKGNEELINSIAFAQADIAKLAIEKWKEKEILKLDKSLSHIIQSNQKEEILFQDKFWVLNDDGSEYFFRNGKSSDLIVKKSDDFKTGNWKLNGNELEIALEGISKTYKIEKLTSDVFEILHNESDEKLKFNIV
jgi:hypothetical protein